MIIDPYKFVFRSTGNGYLYNWYAASDANLMPTDLKVPEQSDFIILYTYLDSLGISSGGSLKETGNEFWNLPNSGATDFFDFSAYGTGIRLGSTYDFSYIKQLCYLWSKTEGSSPIYGVPFVLSSLNSSLSTGNMPKTVGATIRALYIGLGSPSTYTDYDGNVYDVITIGTQKWLKQNWKCTHLANGDLIPNITDKTTWFASTTPARCAYDNNESYV